MPYKLVTIHDNKTLKQISEKAGIEYTKGKGYYLINKPESVAETKELILFENGKFVSDDTNCIKAGLGLSINGDVRIDPSNLSPNQQIFVQSTAPNRKISDDVPVVFYIDDEDDDDDDGTTTTATGTGTNSIKYAINFEAIISGELSTEDDDFSQFFNIPYGTKFDDYDRPVPMDIQLPSLWYLSNLPRTEWSKVEIHQEKLPYTTYDSVIRVTAIGKIHLLLPSSSSSTTTTVANPFEEYPVRLEYIWKDDWSCYGIAIGMLWGAMIGSCNSHPYVLTPDINYGNSDGSSSEYPPIAICECTEKEELKNRGPSGPADFYLSLSNNQKMHSICGHLLNVFSSHCNDLQH